jgi:hypothetical protein
MDAFEGEAVTPRSGSRVNASNFALLMAKYDVSPWLLDPRSKRMRRWDMVIAMALIYTATLTPFEVAFVDSKPSSRIDPSLSSFPIYVINL